MAPARRRIEEIRVPVVWERRRLTIDERMADRDRMRIMADLEILRERLVLRAP